MSIETFPATNHVPDYSWRDLAGVAETLREPIHRRWLLEGVTVASVSVTCAEHSADVTVTLWDTPANDLELLAELRTALHRCGVRELSTPAGRVVVASTGMTSRGILARLDGGQRVRVERYSNAATLLDFDWSREGA